VPGDDVRLVHHDGSFAAGRNEYSTHTEPKNR
jgi:hypothetical protein